MKRSAPVFLLSLLAAACTTDSTDIEADGEDDCFTCTGKADGFGLTDCEVDELLAFVSTAELETLDDDVRLDVRAATGIVAHGAFTSLAELDAVPYVGPVAFGRLIRYADAHELLACDSPDAERCANIEGTIDDCQGLHGLELDECVDIAGFSFDEVGACCASDDFLFFCAELEPIAITEGDPNTEFGETFIALQEEATGDCMPFGGAFFYDASLKPSDFVVANTMAGIFSDGEADSLVETGLDRDRDLAPFLASFGFDLGGLHGAIGFDDYHLSRVNVTSANDQQEVMVLHYRDRNEVWTVSLSCAR